MARVKNRDLIKKVSEKTNKSQIIVSAVIDFYWGEVRKHMTEATGSKIYVKQLGTFNAKEKVVRKLIEKYSESIERLNLPENKP